MADLVEVTAGPVTAIQHWTVQRDARLRVVHHRRTRSTDLKQHDHLSVVSRKQIYRCCLLIIDVHTTFAQKEKHHRRLRWQKKKCIRTGDCLHEKQHGKCNVRIQIKTTICHGYHITNITSLNNKNQKITNKIRSTKILFQQLKLSCFCNCVTDFF